jgi:hypothetical protein
MNRFSSKRGTLLVQTLVLTVLLSFIATLMLKWNFGRHTVSSKVRRSIDARTYIESCMAQKASLWGTNNQPKDGTTETCVFQDAPAAGQTITVDVSISGTNITYKLDYSNI